MNVVSSFSFPRDDGGYRKVSIALGSGDLVRLVDDGLVEGYRLAEDGDAVKIVDEHDDRMPVEAAFRVLQAQADILLWWQVAAEGGATVGYAKSRIQEARSRAPMLLARRS